MSAQQVGRFTLPTPAALPSTSESRVGQVAVVGGVPFVFDGTAWQRLGGSSVTFLTGSLDVNVGTIPTPEYVTTAAVVGATVGSRVFLTLAPTAPGKDADDVGMDVIDAWGFVPTDGQLAVRLTGLTGPIADAFTVSYLIARG